MTKLISVSVPDELRAEMEALKGKFNFSAAAREGIEAALERHRTAAPTPSIGMLDEASLDRVSEYMAQRYGDGAPVTLTQAVNDLVARP